MIVRKTFKKSINDGSTIDATAAKKTYLRWAVHNHRNHHSNQNIFWAKGNREHCLHLRLLYSLFPFLSLGRLDLMVKKPIQ